LSGWVLFCVLWGVVLFAFCGERKFFITPQKEKKGKFSVIKCENPDILCIFCGFPCILGHYPL